MLVVLSYLYRHLDKFKLAQNSASITKYLKRNIMMEKQFFYSKLSSEERNTDTYVS